MKTTLLSAVESIEEPEPISPEPLNDQLRELVADVLTDDNRVVIYSGDPSAGDQRARWLGVFGRMPVDRICARFILNAGAT